MDRVTVYRMLICYFWDCKLINLPALRMYQRRILYKPLPTEKEVEKRNTVQKKRETRSHL